jgi:multidrug transporter EmrE-like cation transporter
MVNVILNLGETKMIETAWDEYRGWAARARELQIASKKWNTAALISVVVAAFCGAAATQAAGTPVGRAFSLLAAIAAALTPILGREIFALGNEAKWIQSRAIGEAIKSECFRFAARSGIYAGADAENRFLARRDELAASTVEAGLAPKSDPAGEKGDKRRPSDSMDPAWYIVNRIDDQITYYSQRQAEHEAAVKRLRYFAFGASAVAAVFGVAGLTSQQIFAPWIGTLTTVVTAVAAYGLLDRREYLAASFAAMATGLRRIKDCAGSLALVDFVTQAEDLMRSEHAAWTERMTQTIAVPKIKQ